MALNPVLLEKLNAALQRMPVAATRRDATLPAVPGKVHAVIGMRRAGKTTFLHQLHAERLATRRPEQALYLSFDDDRLMDLPLEQLNQLLEEYYRRYPDYRGHQTVTWLFDEIQWVTGWERFTRRLMDTERVEIVVSGSSAKLLSREVHTSLRGRGIETIIRPFSFREFLRHRASEPERPADRLTAAERSRVESLLVEFLSTGGFPEVQALARDTRLELLQSYVDTVLFRDILERHRISQVAALRWLTRQFLKSAAASFSVHRFHQDLRSQGLGVSKDALHAMVAYLEDAFLIRSVALATESERRRNSNPRKVYPVDQGLIPAFDRSGRTNQGHALETVVLHELDRRRAEVGYVKTAEGLEVDFLARFRDGREELVQVCSDLTQPETLNRELRALAEAGREHPKALRRILVATSDAVPPQSPPDVLIQPAYLWLLEVLTGSGDFGTQARRSRRTAKTATARTRNSSAAPRPRSRAPTHSRRPSPQPSPASARGSQKPFAHGEGAVR